MPTDSPRDPRVQAVLDIPLHRFLEVALRDESDASAGIRFPVGPAALNPGQMLHGGIVYALLDVASFLALLPSLSAGERAVTHDVAASLLRPVAAGATVDLTATVLRRGRAVAFMRAEASVDGVLVATGQVTKTVIAAR